MKAPSPRCLRALRSLAYQEQATCLSTQARRAFASSPPPTKPAPTLQYRPPLQQPRTRTPANKLRQVKDDDDDFRPTPLDRPIGMLVPPQPGDNMDLDTRTLKQKRDDFVDYEKHLQKRARMTRQLSRPYFKDWSDMRFHKGKQFIANDRPFRADHALYMPNIYGKTLRADAERINKGDGYDGLGRNTCEVMQGRISIVSIASSAWAENQVATFLSKTANPELHQIMEQSKNITQLVEVNREDNLMKWYLIQLFVPTLRKQRSIEQQARYFMVRQKFMDDIKEAIGTLNDKVGYIYLVDAACRIRWAGNAEAQPQEIESLNKSLRKLIHDSESPEEDVSLEKLEDAVAEVVI